MVRKLNIDKCGLGLFFGSTEVRIMEKFWSIYPRASTHKNVHIWLRRDGFSGSRSTVATTIIRLVRRGALTRVSGEKLRGPNAHTFSAACSRDEFLESSMLKIVQKLNGEFEEELDYILREYFGYK